MKKHSNVGADFNFRVEKVRVHQQGVLLDPKKPFFEIKKTAEFGGTTLNVGVREDYTVVQYPDFVEAIESGLEREGIRDQFTSMPIVFGGGARFCMRFKTLLTGGYWQGGFGNSKIQGAIHRDNAGTRPYGKPFCFAGRGSSYN